MPREISKELSRSKNSPSGSSNSYINDDASVVDGVAGIVSRYGPIDILVNNAGIPGGGAIEETSLELFRSVMETNFFGGLRCIKAVVRSMRERRTGVIVNVTSVAGRVAMSPQAAYASSKWAFEALSEILAQELKAFNVRVAIVEPGVVATPIFKKGSPLVENSPYPHLRRLRAIFAASLTSPTLPDVVARQIVEIGGWGQLATSISGRFRCASASRTAQAKDG